MQATAEQQTTLQATIDPDDFLTALTPVTKLVDEARLRLTDDGLQTSAVDPANVGMIDLTLSNDAFESLTVDADDALVLGVNLNRLTSQVKAMANEPVDEDQILTVELDPETNKLTMQTDPGTMEFTMALIDPESIRQEPNLPDLDLAGHVSLSASYFDHLVKTADDIGEHVTFGMDNESFKMVATGDTDDWEATVTAEHPAVETLDAAPAQSIYSLAYLNDMRKGIPSDSVIDIDLGDEHPVRMTFSFLDGAATGTYMVAPRIEENG